MSKESFKSFVRKHPSLINYVNSGDMSWQKFYEIYDMYGEASEAWNPYFNKTSSVTSSSSSMLGDTSLKDLFNVVKRIDMDTVKRGVDGLQKAVALIQDFSTSKTQVSSSYQRRPMYKYFED